jgi:lipoprotein-releasing system ATP-binding protein
MSDDLKRMLGQPQGKRPAAGDPRLRTIPCVRGGTPLVGGPKLELDAVAAGTANPAPPNGRGGPQVPARPHIDIEAARPSEAAKRPHPTPPGHHLLAIGLHKRYRKGPVEVPVLTGVNLGVRQGEFLAVVGQSGSGKSTLLHLLGTIDSPDKGEIHLEGQRIDDLPASHRDAVRNRRIGMIFQFYHLLPELSALENALAPIMIAQSSWAFFRKRREHHARASELLELVGLGHRVRHKPRELSGGETQRVAIARALIAQPELLLADEPTGNLDQQTGRGIVELLRTLNEQRRLTIVMVTHDQAIAEQADRVVRLVGGRIEQP